MGVSRREYTKYPQEFRDWCCTQIAARDDGHFTNEMLNEFRAQGYPKLSKQVVWNWWIVFKGDKDRVEAIAQIRKTEIELKKLQEEHRKTIKAEKIEADLDGMTPQERVDYAIDKLTKELDTKDSGSQSRLNIVKELEGLQRLQKSMSTTSPELQEALKEIVEACRMFGADPVRLFMTIASKIREQHRRGVVEQQEMLANVGNSDYLQSIDGGTTEETDGGDEDPDEDDGE